MTAALPAIRPASDDDWHDVAALLEGARLPLEGARAHLAQFVIAERDGHMVGTGGLELHGSAALLRSLVVTEPGRGLGTRLVEALLTLAHTHGVEDVVLLLEEGNSHTSGRRGNERDGVASEFF